MLKIFLEKIPSKSTRVTFEACSLLARFLTGYTIDVETAEKIDNEVKPVTCIQKKSESIAEKRSQVSNRNATCESLCGKWTTRERNPCS